MESKILKILSQKYFTMINLILITAFVGINTGTMYDVLTNVIDGYLISPLEVSENRKTTSTRMRKKAIASYNKVAKRDLFKTPLTNGLEKKDKVLDVDVMDLTDLKLKLWGTIVAGVDFSSAIIEETKTRKQKLYKIGDSIQTAMLTHILRNKVVLSVNGKDEILEIESKPGKNGKSLPRRSSPVESGKGPTKDITIKRSLIEDSMANLNQLMKDVRIRPHFKNGESDGLIVSGIKGGSVFRKLGLRNGDIIMGVDGAQIESVDDAMKLYNGLGDLENMKVDIKRRGKVQTLNFNVE